MSVFISYSSRDKDFAQKLALELVKNRIHVWIDLWEIKAGDSLIDKIQKGIENTSFLLVVLSKNSVESEWCKKEINAAFMREIELKEVVIVPVLMEKCDIPLLLKEKLYADFTTSFEDGINRLLRPLSKLISDHIGRSNLDNSIIDYAISVEEVDNLFSMQIDAVLIYPDKRFSALIQTTIVGNKVATERWHSQKVLGLAGMMSETIILMMINSSDFQKLQLLLRDDRPHVSRFVIRDSKNGIEFKITIRARLLGENPSNDKLLEYIDTLKILSITHKDN